MRPYDSALEHLDDVAGWVAQVFDRAQAAEAERRKLDTALAARVERIEARLAASRAAGQPLPWDPRADRAVTHRKRVHDEWASPTRSGAATLEYAAMTSSDGELGSKRSDKVGRRDARVRGDGQGDARRAGLTPI